MDSDSDTLMAARSRPNDDWGSVGNGAKSRRKARKWWLRYVCCSMYNTGSSLLVAETRTTRYRKRAHKRTKQEKPTQREKPASGSHDPKPVVPQTNYHTLTTMGFQLLDSAPKKSCPYASALKV